MRALTPAEQEIAESLALALADVMSANIPALFAEPPELVVGITLPIACSLVRAEARAARNRKHAKRYRKLKRQVRELLRTEPETSVHLPDLGRTIAFDPAAWHAELRLGAGHQVFAEEADL